MLSGNVDFYGEGTVAGWAGDLAAPDTPVSVEIYCEGLRVANVVADRPRADLAALFDGRTNKGFSHPIPGKWSPLNPPRLSVRFAGTDIPLNVAPICRHVVNQGMLDRHLLLVRERGNAFIPSPPQALIDHVSGPGYDAVTSRLIAMGTVLEMVDRQILSPASRIIDIGCGFGRIAAALAPYLAENGCYDGFDTWPDGIVWGARQITPVFPNVRFHHLSGGKGYDPVNAYALPVADGEATLVIATSLFTHLQPAAALFYLKECRRTLAPGGKVFLTMFVLPPTSDGAPSRDWATQECDGTVNVFYRHSLIERLAKDAGFDVAMVHHGSNKALEWPIRQVSGFHDLVVLEKPSRS